MTKALNPQAMMKRAAASFVMAIAYILFLSPASLLFAEYYRKVTGDEISKKDAAAINSNFKRIDNEFSNTVHKTSTQTVTGDKYFSGRLEATTHFIPPQAADIDDAITPLKTGEVYYNTAGAEWCGSTATNSGAWVKVHAPTTACAN